MPNIQSLKAAFFTKACDRKDLSSGLGVYFLARGRKELIHSRQRSSCSFAQISIILSQID